MSTFSAIEPPIFVWLPAVISGAQFLIIMEKLLKFSFIILIISLVSACASYKHQYKKAEKDWQKVSLPDKPLAHQLFLIGDIGEDESATMSATLQIMGQKLKQADANSSILFLGDNVHAHIASEKEKKAAITHQKTQLDILNTFKGNVFFIPGNHDWTKEGGVESIRQQEKLVQDYLDRGDTYIPDRGCSGPEVKDLSDNTVLMAINSQWYLENWDNEKGINEDCEFRTRELFLRRLADKLKDNRHKNVILALHHPLYSNGRYGGHYTAKEHLFPLTTIDSKLWIPLPIIGSIYAFLNSAIGSPQELVHPKYQALKTSILNQVDNYSNVLFVSGHEHSLQFFEDEEQDFIVSGSGAKQEPVALGDDATFVAGVKGFSQVYFYRDGEVWVEFWACSDKNRQNLDQTTLIFRKKIKPTLALNRHLTANQFSEYEQLKGQDSIVKSIMEQAEIKVADQNIWGHLYTEEYLTDYKMPVLDLATAKGGLMAYELGGGQQTNAIRLKNRKGKIYQLRSVEKVTDRMPSLLRKTFAVDLVKQQLTAGYPFSPLMVSPMAEAIDIFHTNPTVVYVPKQPNLGRYNDLGGEVYLFEERADGDWSDLKSFGYPEKIEKARKLINKKLKNDKTVIDQPLVLRCRLFDMIIGDWDRHSNQWRWATYEMEDDKKLYKPIPRDRDQAFAKFDGLGNAIADFTFPMVKASENFDGKITKKEATWLNYKARYFDRFFLNAMKLEDWEREAKYIQEHLTDAAIEAAVKKIPPFAYDKRGKDFIEFIKSRRDDLLKVARQYYKVLNKEVLILGTHKDNLFIVNRLNDLQTKVSVYEYNKKKTEKQFLYERTFENEVSKELRLYGLDGADQFQVTGKVGQSPLVRLIGGKGEDSYADNSKVRGWSKRTIIYDDNKEKSTLRLKGETKDKRSKMEMRNTFNYRDYDYNYAIPVPMIGINPDDGFHLNLSMIWRTFSFKRKQNHRFNGSVAFGSGAYSLSYNADYFNTFQNWDMNLQLTAEVPRFVSNFHGLGNETERNTDEFGKDFYRIRRTLLAAYPSFKKRWDSGISFSVGPAFESIKIEEKAERITGADFMEFRPTIFNHQNFSGGNAGFHFYNADHFALPTQGLGLLVDANWRANLQDVDRQMLRFKSELTFFTRLTQTDYFVLENRLHGSHIIGDFDFFQAVSLGGGSSLRGFSQGRFSGRTAFYHTIDLRIKIIDSENSFLPISGGITPGFDYGRVWIKTEDSDKWHLSYGGSIWVAPLDVVALSAGMFFSEEKPRIAVSASVQF